MPYFGIPIRNGLPIGLGSVAGFGIAPFEPYSLFENGEQGAWYDPSDLTTLFQDSAGTTPVTAVEQFVGLMLDKSKGLVLGSELVTNGDFSNGSIGWTVISGAWAVANGRLNAGNTDGIKRYAQNASNIVAGRWYKATWNQYAGAGTGAANWTVPGIWNGSDNLLNGGNYINGAGEKTIYFVAPVSGQFYIYNFEQEVEYDNISVRELLGNHATSTGTKRPKLAARYNLLTYSEQFDNAVWDRLNGVTIASSAVTPPITGASVSKLIAPNSTGTGRTLRQYKTIGVNGTLYTTSVYLRFVPGEFQWVRMLATDTGSVWFDIQNGVVGTTTGATGTITNAGNNWWRCTVTATASSVNIYSYVLLADADNSTTATGDGVKGVLISAADLRPASQATGLIGPTYQRVVDAATYDTVGFLPYLEFDGIDDSMSTGSIDFSATDKMTAWAGVRKLSTSAGWICETSVSIDTNNGAFLLNVDNSGFEYIVASKGTTYRPAQLDNSAYLSPITNVLTEIADISGDSVVMRLNGTQVATNTNDQGTGNYGNYPLFIGARNNASLYFNGWLTSLIVRGAQSTQSQIETTESWVNGKTGAY
jgi:hypothetical protein